VVDLARFLTACGAKIEGAGTSKLIIKGVRKLHGAVYSIIPDRIEAGTFLIAAAITQSTISLSPIIPNHLTAVVQKLRSIGCHFREQDDGCLQVKTLKYVLYSVF
jgi:UDP-N-acetylglucosamine 1-carboxyvinyltransferase